MKSKQTDNDSGSGDDAERRLIGCLLVIGEGGGRVTNPGVVPAELADKQHAAMLAAMLELGARGQASSREDLAARLAIGHGMVRDDALRLIDRLRADAPNQLHVREYARRIRSNKQGQRSGSGRSA